MSQNREMPLSLYVYIVRPGLNNHVTSDQGVNLMAAYTHDEALQALTSKLEPDQQVTIDFKGAFPMQQILGMFKAGAPKPESELVLKTKKEFYKEILEGMLKSVNDFTDQPEVLEKALNKMLSLV